MRLPKGAAFGRAKIVCKRKKRQKCGFAVFSYLFLSILNFTFYILHFTFAEEILRRVAPQDDRKGGHLLASRLPPRGKVSAKPTEEGRRAVLNFTFYILHFTFANEILRLGRCSPSLRMTERGLATLPRSE